MRNYKVRPKTFPEDWATDWGEDEYGLWMAFTYKGIKQAFRWIEPGVFSMGSPEDEPGRLDDETPHEVKLTRGFWLADTVVTQALWEAVMRNNPSNFKGENRPVENVSWEDAQLFIERINSLKPELGVCLATEVQWEYSCRAGTTTRYSFGNEVTNELVNYDSSETLAVKSLPCNDWGLYEMHGNVLEWCADWYGSYETTQLVDLPELKSESSVVLRGGSWINHGRDARSSRRYNGLSPNYRRSDIGFRLARGY